jgi:hypothetical protein
MPPSVVEVTLAVLLIERSAEGIVDVGVLVGVVTTGAAWMVIVADPAAELCVQLLST